MIPIIRFAKSGFWGVQGVQCQKAEVSLGVPVDTPRWPDGCPGVTLGSRSGVGDKGHLDAINQDDACHHGGRRLQGGLDHHTASCSMADEVCWWHGVGLTKSCGYFRATPFPLNSWRYKHIPHPLDTDMQPDSHGRTESLFFRCRKFIIVAV